MDALDTDGCPPLALPALGSYLWSREAIGPLADAKPRQRRPARRDPLARHRRGAASAAPSTSATSAPKSSGRSTSRCSSCTPTLDRATATFALDDAAGTERKTTGSYYTPTSLISSLLDTALEPVLDEAAAGEDPEAAILSLAVVDPACGSGHFLIAAANRIAKRLAAVRSEDPEPSPDELRAALRDVVGRCLYGVDVNPMAVELCKVSLWMEALEPGRPLSFLDHRIVLGNSLLGTTPELIAAGIPADAFKPILGDDKKIVAELRKRNAKELAGQLALDVAAATADADVRAIAGASSAAIAAVDDQLARPASASSSAASSSCSARRSFAEPGSRPTSGAPPSSPTSARARRRSPRTPSSARSAASGSLSPATSWRSSRGRERPTRSSTGTSRSRPCGSAAGSMSCSATRRGSASSSRRRSSSPHGHPRSQRRPNKAARERLIKALAEEDPALLAAFEDAKREAEGASHFIRSSGRYPLCGRGDVNTYAIFAELMRGAVGPTRPRRGDRPDRDRDRRHHEALLPGPRRAAIARQPYDFEEPRRLFPDVGHRRFHFCLWLMVGPAVPIEEAEYAFCLHDARRRSTTRAAPLHPHRRGHRAAQPQHPHLPGVPHPPRRRADQGDLPPRPRPRPRGRPRRQPLGRQVLARCSTCPTTRTCSAPATSSKATASSWTATSSFATASATCRCTRRRCSTTTTTALATTRCGHPEVRTRSFPMFLSSR